MNRNPYAAAAATANLSKYISKKFHYRSSSSAQKSRESDYTRSMRVAAAHEAATSIASKLTWHGSLPKCPRCGTEHPTNVSLTEIERITAAGHLAVVCPQCGLVGPKRSYIGFAIKYYQMACEELLVDSTYLRLLNSTPPKFSQSEFNFNSPIHPLLVVADIPEGYTFTVKGTDTPYTKIPSIFVEGKPYNCTIDREGTKTLARVGYDVPVQQVLT